MTKKKKKNEPLEINMKIELNAEAFDGLAESTKQTFMILINSEMEKMANTLSRKASLWMFDLRHNLYGKKDDMDKS